MKKILITIILLTNLPVAAATGYTPAHILTISLITNQCIFNSNKKSGWQRYYETKYQICNKYKGGNACKKYKENKHVMDNN